MLETRVTCPSCGAPLTFQAGTMVSVCSRCRSLSARTDRDPRLIGKVADLVATGSRLRLGQQGRFAGRPFRLVGRTQLRHPLGGVWDEWYLAFGDGRWGWLAEAQGRFLLTFRQELTVPVPPPESLEPGAPLDLGPHGQWVVAEVSEAALASAEGEIPWEVDPGSVYRFADLSGRGGAFATLDYSEAFPLFFPGRETPLDDLHLEAFNGPPTGEAMKGQALPCPHCASPLRLQAPDQAERVVCPSCGSLLDANQGRLTFLKSLQQPDPHLVIPLGTEGLLRGRSVVVTGCLIRSSTQDGETFRWREYLLLDTRAHHFLWLVESDGHWSLAEGVAPAEVGKGVGLNRTWKGMTFRAYQDYEAVVEGVWGEFYWKIEQGERVRVLESACAPCLMAEEHQKHQGGKGAEVTFSLSTYLEGKEIWEAFKLKGSPRPPEGIAPHQPNPNRAKARSLGTWMMIALGLWLAVLLFQIATHTREVVYQGTFDLAEAATQAQARKVQPGGEGADVVFFSPPFQVKHGHKNLAVVIHAPLDNAWIEVDGAVASQTANTVEFFQTSVSHYHGVDGGEAWREGGQLETTFLSALPPGTYVLRLAPQWEGTLPPVRTMTVEVRSGQVHAVYYLLALLAILLPPLLQLFRMWGFEGSRWANSSYTTGGGDA